MSLFLYGASGHGKVVAEIAEVLNRKIEAFIDNNPDKTQVLDYKVIHQVPTESIEVILSIGNNQTRKSIAALHPNFNYSKLIHPLTAISTRAEIGEGTVVMPGSVINSEAKIGKHCIINSNSSIEHECRLGDYVHISPNVALAGNVEVGEGTHIGIGASVIQGVKIGKWATIGAGAVVVRDIPDFAVAIGVPAKVMKYNS